VQVKRKETGVSARCSVGRGLALLK